MAESSPAPAPVPPAKRPPILKTILIAVAVVIVALAALVALQPADFRIERSATIAAPPADVFEHVNDLHKWEAWSPWVKLDPAMKTTYEGADAGVGAIYSWVGNSKVGEGRTTITESHPHDLIRLQLDFARPMEGTSVAVFTFRPEGDQTVVTWTMTGTNNFVGKAYSLLVNMDKMVGGQFDEGLASLKEVVEPKSPGAGDAPQS